MSSDANNNSDIRPLEDITAQDIEKLSPSAMRENNADYFLAQMYRTARDIVAYNYRGSITPDTEIHFGWGIKQHFGQEHRNFYIYQKGTIYLCNLYEMLPRIGIPVAHFTPEQDKVFRHAVQSVVKYHKNPYLYDSAHGKMKEFAPEKLVKPKYRPLLEYFGCSIQNYQEQNPLQSPVRCDGCERRCHMGYQKHPLNPYDEFNRWYNEYPTINHIFANGCPEKCAAKIQEYPLFIKQKTALQKPKKAFTQEQRINIKPEQENVYVPSPGKCNGCDAECELGTTFLFDKDYVYPTIDGKIMARYINEKHHYQYTGTSTIGWGMSPQQVADRIAGFVGTIARVCDHYKQNKR